MAITTASRTLHLISFSVFLVFYDLFGFFRTHPGSFTSGVHDAQGTLALTLEAQVLGLALGPQHNHDDRLRSPLDATPSHPIVDTPQASQHDERTASTPAI
jgi:hypothetical protein